jgi:hypothetical protein
MSIEAMKLALEALEAVRYTGDIIAVQTQTNTVSIDKAITALRTAIAQADHSEQSLDMVGATVKKHLPVEQEPAECPTCGGGGLLPDPTWDWVRCYTCRPSNEEKNT